MTSRRLLIAGAVAALLLIAVGAGVYIYFFSGLRTSPSALTLEPTASPASPPASAAAVTDPSGTWTVATGSVAGYRVREQFAGESSLHEAVARTSSVTGGLTAVSSGSGYQVTALNFTADLTGLHSIDQVAGHDVSQRDSTVSRSLQVSRFPTAVFKAAAVSVPADITTGAIDSLSVPGQLTIHGVTRDVTAAVQVRLQGAKVQVDGSIQVQMGDFNIAPPQAPFVTIQTAVTIEFQLFLAKS